MTETMMQDGDWLFRKNSNNDNVWVSHMKCYDTPRRVQYGRCHQCQAKPPENVMGFLELLKWEV